MTKTRERMLKAIEGKFTPEEVDRRIGEWLEMRTDDIRSISCPFSMGSGLRKADYPHEICTALFRAEFKGDPLCPCGRYGLEKCIRVAKAALH